MKLVMPLSWDSGISWINGFLRQRVQVCRVDPVGLFCKNSISCASVQHLLQSKVTVVNVFKVLKSSYTVWYRTCPCVIPSTTAGVLDHCYFLNHVRPLFRFDHLRPLTWKFHEMTNQWFCGSDMSDPWIGQIKSVPTHKMDQYSTLCVSALPCLSHFTHPAQF